MTDETNRGVFLEAAHVFVCLWSSKRGPCNAKTGLNAVYITGGVCGFSYTEGNVLGESTAASAVES